MLSNTIIYVWTVYQSHIFLSFLLSLYIYKQKHNNHYNFTIRQQTDRQAVSVGMQSCYYNSG